jgi:hypothetical protein
LDEETDRALSSAILLAESIAGLKDALSMGGGGLLSLGGLTSIVGILGTVGSIIGSIVGESPEEADRRRLLEQNNKELANLALKVSGFRITGTTTQDAARAAASLAAELGTPAYGSLSVRGQIALANPKDGFAEFLRRFNLTWDQFAKIAQENGIRLLDDNGRLIAGAVEQFAEALGMSVKAITQFNDSLPDMRRLREARDQIFDVEDTPGNALDAQLDLISRFAPQLAKQFGLDTADSSTAEGREAIEQALRALFTLIESGGLTTEALGGFADKEELLSVILGADGALDRFSDMTKRATESLSSIPTGFRMFNLQLARFNATLPDVVAPSGGGTGGGGTSPRVPVIPTRPEIERPTHIEEHINLGGVQVDNYYPDIDWGRELRPLLSALQEHRRATTGEAHGVLEV